MRFSLFHLSRKKLLNAPIPENWLPYLQRNVRHYGGLSAEHKKTLGGITQVLVDEKNWEGCKGLQMTDEIRVTIAAQAALLVLGLPNEYYANVESILVYPKDYVATDRVMEPGRVVSESQSNRLGEAWSEGPIILSWPDVLDGGRNPSDGRNVVFHEFAHKLDFQNGKGDGVPRLGSRQEYDRWSEVMSSEFQTLDYLVATQQPTLLNPYGATNPAEFFAVATECFFERPRELKHLHPNLYEVLSRYYHQDPAATKFS